MPLGSLLSRHYNCPVRVEVDTDAAALAERRFGKDDSPRLLYLTLSTGMGGGLLLDGAIYRGYQGAHPEVAHQAIPYIYSGFNPVLCSCGNDDCLEALVSGNGIRRLYKCRAEELSPQQWDEVAGNLGQGLRNMATLYAPQVIVLGGGVALGGGEPFLAKATQVMRDHLVLVPAPLVRFSRLGYDTALMGAIALGRQAANWD
jgi:predicted NBD/HSP70 family sugar kinase